MPFKILVLGIPTRLKYDCFLLLENLIRDISGWDTSNVTNMKNMFSTYLFNQPIKMEY